MYVNVLFITLLFFLFVYMRYIFCLMQMYNNNLSYANFLR